MESESTSKYTINEIFYSLQGEGVRAGIAHIFIRFSGCNLQCTKETIGFDCDTEFVSGVSMSSGEILERLEREAPNCKWVILTGGEPLLQLDGSFVDALKQNNYSIAIETNGSIALKEEFSNKIDWITCSPKVAEHSIRLQRCNELKYVRAHGQGIPKPQLKLAQHKLISPAFEGSEVSARTLQWCVQLVKENPEWRLSTQQHKWWGIR